MRRGQPRPSEIQLQERGLRDVFGVMPITAQQVRRGPQALCAFAEVPGELAVPRRARPGRPEATFGHSVSRRR
jgi:hypothetical protein